MKLMFGLLVLLIAATVVILYAGVVRERGGAAAGCIATIALDGLMALPV
jgi:hypothetical protein